MTRRRKIILIVIAALVIMAGVLLIWGGDIASWALDRGTDVTKVETTRDTITLAMKRLEQYRDDMGDYPRPGQGGWQALIAPPDDPADAEAWDGEYMDEPPSDAWGNELVYEPAILPGEQPTVYSVGPNGNDEGGEGDDVTLTAGPDKTEPE